MTKCKCIQLPDEVVPQVQVVDVRRDHGDPAEVAVLAVEGVGVDGVAAALARTVGVGRGGVQDGRGEVGGLRRLRRLCWLRLLGDGHQWFPGGSGARWLPGATSLRSSLSQQDGTQEEKQEGTRSKLGPHGPAETERQGDDT